MPSRSTTALEMSLASSPKVEHTVNLEKSLAWSFKVEYSYFL